MKSFIFAQAAVVSPGAGATCECVWVVFMGVAACVCIKKQTEKCVCVCTRVCACARSRLGRVSDLDSGLESVLPRLLYFQTFLAFFEAWWVLF